MREVGELSCRLAKQPIVLEKRTTGTQIDHPGVNPDEAGWNGLACEAKAFLYISGRC